MIKEIKKKALRVEVAILAVMIAITFSVCNTDGIVYADTSSKPTGVTADHYNMDVTLNTAANSMNEVVTMKITNNSGQNLDKICIRNYAASVIKEAISSNKGDRKINKKKTSKIIGITREDGASKEKLAFTVGSDPSVVYADLGGKTLKNGETATITVNCKTDIPKNEDRFAYQKSKAGKIYELSFCFVQMAPYKDGKWNESPYYNSGENRAASCTDYDMIFRAPKDYTVVATGDENTKDGITTIKAENVRDMSVVASNYMKVKTGTVDGITVNNYYLANNGKKTYKNIGLQAALDSVKLFNEKIGKYPYSELDVIQTNLGGPGNGMEYPGLIMIDGTGYGPKSTTKKIKYLELALCSTVAHEVAHEWFFSTIGNDEYKEAWLDEGFASYYDTLVYETVKTDSMTSAMKLWGYKVNNNNASTIDELIKKTINQWSERNDTTVNKAVNQFAGDDDYGLTVYSGGMLFLADLKLTMGEETFDKAIREYYNTYYLKEATTADFLKVIRKYDNSANVNKVINMFISTQNM